jgi:SAM-dependent methyltransferase
MESGMAEAFYDKVTRKFGTSEGVPRPLADYPQGNPEAIFEQKLLELSGEDKVALDLGCGDGRFTLRLADHFQEIVGIDGSVERLTLAQIEQHARAQNNVRFEKRDAYQTAFAENIFDLVYSRRGPSPYHECHRILKSGGQFAMISIGEKDAWDLKQTFGRGQGYRVWNISALEQAQEQLQEARFEIAFRQEAFYDEYYASLHDLDVFLQSVPIFEDFDSEKDRSFLETYVARFQTDKGIHLPRHRYLFVAVKA